MNCGTFHVMQYNTAFQNIVIKTTHEDKIACDASDGKAGKKVADTR